MMIQSTDTRLERSVVIPAYNEAARIAPYLASVRDYADRKWPRAYEVIVVDDGSTDGTYELLTSLAADWPELQPLRHEVNQGKGAAVRTGMLAAAGALLLMADADGATPIDQEARLADAIAGTAVSGDGPRNGADLAVGSRLMRDPAVQRRRAWSRAILGRLFAMVARSSLGLAVHDTQCGFKMFQRDVAVELFAKCQESGFLFDLEILARARRRGYRIVEVPINWSEIPGGHLGVARQLPSIIIELWRLRRRMKRW